MSKQDWAFSNELLQLTELIHIIADDKFSALAVIHSVDAKWINLSYAVTTNLLGKSTTSPLTPEALSWTLREETFLQLVSFKAACTCTRAEVHAYTHKCPQAYTHVHIHTEEYRFLSICSNSVAEFYSQNLTMKGGNSAFPQHDETLMIARTNTIFFPLQVKIC